MAVDILARMMAASAQEGGGGSSVNTYSSAASFPDTGEEGKLYVAQDTGAIYIWDGDASEYVPVGGGSSGKVGTISIGTAWEGTDPYTQTATATGYTVTDGTKVDLLYDETILSQLKEDNIDLIYIENNDGTLLAYAFGGMPSEGITVNAIFTEVIS